MATEHAEHRTLKELARSLIAEAASGGTSYALPGHAGGGVPDPMIAQIAQASRVTADAVTRLLDRRAVRLGGRGRAGRGLPGRHGAGSRAGSTRWA